MAWEEQFKKTMALLQAYVSGKMQWVTLTKEFKPLRKELLEEGILVNISVNNTPNQSLRSLDICFITQISLLDSYILYEDPTNTSEYNDLYKLLYLQSTYMRGKTVLCLNYRDGLEKMYGPITGNLLEFVSKINKQRSGNEHISA